MPITSASAATSAGSSFVSSALSGVADGLIPGPIRRAAETVQSVRHGARSVTVDKATFRRRLLKCYVNLAFAKEDQIMCSTQVGTAVTCGVADIFTFGLTTIITKNIEGPVMATIRGVRRVQASQMFSAVDALSLTKLQQLTTQTVQQGEPGFDWLRNQLSASSNAAAAASAASSAAASAAVAQATSQASATTASAVQDVFVDYITDAVFDQVTASLPFGLGALKSGAQVAQVSVRVNELRVQILMLKPLAA